MIWIEIVRVAALIDAIGSSCPEPSCFPGCRGTKIWIRCDEMSESTVLASVIQQTF